MPICTVCAVGVAAGVGLSRWLKIDDLISGVWIGALLLILAMASVNWFFKRKKKESTITGYFISALLWLIASFAPLYFVGFFKNNNCPEFWGIPKLLIGVGIGFLAILFSFWIDKISRRSTNGKARFPYQKAIIPLSILIIISLILWKVC